MVETLAYTYTSEAEMQRLFSEEAVDLRLDDLDDTAVTLTEVIGDATDTINQYAAMIHNEADLAESMWVRRRATWIACHFLSQRRGDPAQYQVRYEHILEELEKVRDMEIVIPRMPTREDFTPAMTNYHVNNRFYIHNVRVVSSISTGGSSSRQLHDIRFPFDWF